MRSTAGSAGTGICRRSSATRTMGMALTRMDGRATGAPTAPSQRNYPVWRRLPCSTSSARRFSSGWPMWRQTCRHTPSRWSSPPWPGRRTTPVSLNRVPTNICWIPCWKPSPPNGSRGASSCYRCTCKPCFPSPMAVPCGGDHHRPGVRRRHCGCAGPRRGTALSQGTGPG